MLRSPQPSQHHPARASRHGDTASSSSSSADDVLDAIHRKFAHISLDRSGLGGDSADAVDVHAIAHLLPYHRHAVTAAIDSGVRDYAYNAVVQIRRYLSLDRVASAVDNVLALDRTDSLVALLGGAPLDDALLHYELCWVLTNICAGTSAQTAAVAGVPGALHALVHHVAKNPALDVRVQAAWCLGNVAGDGPALRNAVVAAGVVPAIVEFYGAYLAPPPPPSQPPPVRRGSGEGEDEEEEWELPASLVPVARITAWLMANLCRGTRAPAEWINLAPLFPILVEMLAHRDLDTVVDACWGLSRILHGVGVFAAEEALSLSLASDDEGISTAAPAVFSAPSSTSSIGSPITPALCHRLMQLLRLERFPDLSPDDATRLRTPVLRALTNIASGDDPHSAMLVAAGAVPALYELARVGLGLANRLPPAVALPDDPAAHVSEAAALWVTAFAPRAVPPAFAREALLALSNLAAAADPADTVRRVLGDAAVPALWRVVLEMAVAGSGGGGGGDLRAAREAAWGLANVTATHAPDTAALLLARCGRSDPEVEERGDLASLLIRGLALGLGPAALSKGLGDRDDAGFASEVRDKCADALHNLVLSVGAGAVLGLAHRATLQAVAAWIPRRERRVHGRIAAVNEMAAAEAEAERQRGGGVVDAALMRAVEGMVLD
ncbi:hypothetical protein H9P43_009546 [Blastocladiella emersonii ATCC 22665]|nr:hypothetical protein H9P43_009546 [Blastocladiella emersonii ATCC 22665]